VGIARQALGLIVLVLLRALLAGWNRAMSGQGFEQRPRQFVESERPEPRLQRRRFARWISFSKQRDHGG